MAALALLVTGASRLLFGAKPMAFYTGNPAFHVKVSLFVLAARIWPAASATVVSGGRSKLRSYSGDWP